LGPTAIDGSVGEDPEKAEVNTKSGTLPGTCCSSLFGNC